MNYAQSNPFSAPHADQVAAYAAETDRIAFIQRTYLHLCGAILAFVAFECLIFTAIPQQRLESMVGLMLSGYNWLLVMGGFLGVGWMARRWAESGASSVKQYSALALYVVAEAIIFVPILAIAQWRIGGDVIQSAAITTLLMFGGLTAVVFVGRFDFSFMRMFLVWGGLLAFGFIICAIIFGFDIGALFSVLMIALASGYILYDTSNVLHHFRTDQHVAASLALFASVAFLFYYVLMFFMNRD